MFSALTERGAAATLDALALGATDYVTKPSQLGSVDAAVQSMRDELVPKIRALAPNGNGTRAGRVDVVAIGVSTGGPNALAALIPQLPASLGVPVLIVQHMPPTFTRLLAERLDAGARLQVCECVAGQELVPGQVWVAPGDHHMVVRRQASGECLGTHQGPAVNSCRPAVGVLFESVAQVYGASALGLVMTGMGRDGLAGCRRVRASGGHVIAQDEASSVV